MEARLTIDVRGIPELVWELRHEVSAILLAEAEADPSTLVARRLREIAAAFETGASGMSHQPRRPG